MDNIISQLYQIESTASSILEKAQAQKKELAALQEERIRDFEEQTRLQTENEIKKQRELINAQIQAELQKEKCLADKKLAQFEQEYETSHSTLAKQLLSDLLN